MTAATTTPGARAASVTPAGPTFARLLAAEWTKLTSLRSPWWAAAVTVALAGAITYLSAQASSGDPGFEPVGSLASGLLLAQVGPLVLGVLVGAGEFRTGTFRTTFTLAPRRWPVLAAQVTVLGAFALATGVVATAASAVALLPSAASRGLTLDLTADGAPGLMLGMVGYLTGLALLGLAIGALLRRTVPALVAALFLVLILPMVLILASDPMIGGADLSEAAAPTAGTTVTGTLVVLSPGGAGSLMTTATSAGPMDGSPDLGPVGGGLVFAAWIAVVLVAAAVRLRARDVR